MVKYLKTYNQSAIYPVKKEDRVFGNADMALLWAGSAIAVDVWYSGGYLSPLGWIPGIVMIIMGSIAGSLIFATSGILGFDLGVPSMVTTRGSFGIRGSYIMSVLNYLTLVGWTAWMININASAAQKVSSMLFGINAFPLWIIIGGISSTALAIFRAEGWKWFTRIVVSVLLLVTLAINALLFLNFGWGFLVGKPTGGMPLWVGFDLALIIPLSWAPLASDYSRFAKSSRGSFLGSFFGQSSVNALFFVTGLACALSFGVNDPTVYVTMVGGVAFGIGALYVIWLGTITTTFLDIYSANMSLINIYPRLKEWQGSVATGIIGMIIAFLPWLDVFIQFLYLIGAVFVTLFAIVLADYFIVRKRNYTLEELYGVPNVKGHLGGIKITAIISWLTGIAFFFLIQATFPNIGATMLSFVFTAAMYIFLKNTIGKMWT